MFNKRIFFLVIIVVAFTRLLSGSEIIMNTNKIPIIYTQEYDIGLLNIEKLHPFDTAKYSKVYKYLVEKCGISKEQFFMPQMASDEDLLLIHTSQYLNSLKKSKNIAEIIEIGILSIIPNFILRKAILRPMKYATGGTILGCKLALKYGWAINLSGGYHHAKVDSGSGFCFFADIPIAANRLRENNPNLTILIIDLDAHQGNGLESIFKDDPKVYIFDVYNEFIYPQDHQVKKYIDFNYPVEMGINDMKYLSILYNHLADAVEKVKPDIIIYNAGTDIYEKDPLGALNISMQGIIKRDEIIFREAIENEIPILMVLSGGYTKQSAKIIGKSIENILNNVIGYNKSGGY